LEFRPIGFITFSFYFLVFETTTEEEVDI